jgi:hypothetical protein
MSDDEDPQDPQEESIPVEPLGGTWTVIATDNGDKPESDK